jgi:vancomycin resistance protein YoaR
LGLDATVDWDGIDFKFKNTSAYPIYIEAYSENRKLNINIYSNSSLAVKKYNISNNIYETVPSSVKIIDDPNIPEGQVLVEQKGYDGHKVKTVRNIYENGAVVGTETISDDFYTPVPSIVRKGVKTDK